MLYFCILYSCYVIRITLVTTYHTSYFSFPKDMSVILRFLNYREPNFNVFSLACTFSACLTRIQLYNIGIIIFCYNWFCSSCDKDKAWTTGCDYLPNLCKVILCVEKAIVLVDIKNKGKKKVPITTSLKLLFV